jgi:uncharacterized alkaline shock family protein YloU
VTEVTEEIRFEGLGIAPGVLDTIVTVAAQNVDGVATIGAAGIAGLVQRGRKGTARPVDICRDEGGEISVTLHVQIEYGRNLREVGAAVQKAVADAMKSQVGVDIGLVDVYVDGVVFTES